MDLLSSFNEILNRLEDWRGFPKYALERRLDIFLTPFVAPYLAARMGAPVELVAPGFPLKRDEDARSTNVDYLLHRGGPRPAWLFLELKTDCRSMRRKGPQLAIYLAAKERGFADIVGDIERDILPNTRHRPKYQRLLKAVTEPRGNGNVLRDEIEVVYLSPKAPTKDRRVAWYSFSDFASWTPSTHRQLWERMKPLVEALHEDEDG